MSVRLSPHHSQASLVLTLASVLVIIILGSFAVISLFPSHDDSFDDSAFRLCARDQAEEAVLASVLSGGLPKGDVLRIGSSYTIRVWLDDDTLSIPSREAVESYLSTDITTRLVKSCTMVFYQHDPSVKVSIRSDDVLVDIQPFAVNGSHRVKPVRIRIAYPYGRVYDTLSRVVREVHAFRVLENISTLAMARVTPFSLSLSCDDAGDPTRVVYEASRILLQTRLNDDSHSLISFSLPAVRASGLAITFAPLPRLARADSQHSSRLVTLSMGHACASIQAGWARLSLPFILQADSQSFPVPMRIGMRMRFVNTHQPPGSVRPDTFCDDVTVDNLTLSIRDDTGTPVREGRFIISCPQGGVCSIPFANGVFDAPIPWRCDNLSIRVEAEAYYPARFSLALPPHSSVPDHVMLERAPRYTLETRGSCEGMLIGLYTADSHTFEPIHTRVFSPPRKDVWEIALGMNGRILEAKRLPQHDARIRINLANACSGMPAIEVVS